MTPSPKGRNGGRDHRGRFAAGWKGGPGNPFARKVAELRSALLEAVTADDVQAVVKALLAKALSGDVAAAREVLFRVLGPPVEVDLIARLEILEEALAGRQT